jgi:hypothetical protein
MQENFESMHWRKLGPKGAVQPVRDHPGRHARTACLHLRVRLEVGEHIEGAVAVANAAHVSPVARGCLRNGRSLAVPDGRPRPANCAHLRKLSLGNLTVLNRIAPATRSPAQQDGNRH